MPEERISPVRSAEEAAPEEVLISQWDEPQRTHQDMSQAGRLRIIIGGILIAGVCILVAVLAKQLNLYFAAAVTLAAMFAILQQGRRAEQPFTVTVTNLRIEIGARTVAIADLKGYWLARDEQGLIIHFEPGRTRLMPISCFYPGDDPDAARAALTPVLSELEPPAPHFTDRFDRFFRF